MQDADLRLLRNWRKIAARASKETTRSKLAQAVEELRTALNLYKDRRASRNGISLKVR
jgi:ribosome-associated translation inhibitor RaiA